MIGTLYCAKGNFDFGISRIVKSLEPYERKLGTDTWYYAKRCFLSLSEALAKHMLTLTDATFEEINRFFLAAESHGANILTVVAGSPDADKTEPWKCNVAYEARILRNMFLKLRD